MSLLPNPISIFLLSLLCAFLYNGAQSPSTPFISPDSKILLLTAHPDDECMFFAPTLLALKDLDVHSLCLSTGNADGLGEVRKAELEASLDVLGVGNDKRWIVDHPELQDNMTMFWDPQVISQVISPFILDNGINVILTFDKTGISQHPNHKSLPAGVKYLLNSSSSSAVKLYTLFSVSTVEKYTSILAATLAKVDLLSKQNSPVYVFVSGWSAYAQALKAMKQHKTQLVWFRSLYVLFSRYMWVNEWREVKV